MTVGAQFAVLVAPIVFTYFKIDVSVQQISLGGVITLASIYFGANVIEKKYAQD